MSRILFVLPILTLLLGCIPIADLGEYWDKGVIDKDLEGEWKQVGVEHALENQYLSFIQKDGYYEMSTASPDDLEDIPKVPMHCKTLMVGKHKYLMLDLRQNRIASELAIAKSIEEMMSKEELERDVEYKKEMSKRRQELENAKRFGGLQLYTIEDDVLTQYHINEESFQKAIKDGEVSGTVDDPKRGGELSLSLPSLVKLDGKTLDFLEKFAGEDDFWQKRVKYKRISDMKSDLKKSATYEPKKTSDVEVTVDIPDFKYFLDGKVDVFKRQLQASPEWDVVQEGMSITCFHRQLRNGSWSRERGGQESSDVHPFHALINEKENRPHRKPNELQNAYSIRRCFSFAEERTNKHPMMPDPSHYKVVSPLAGKMELTLRSDASGITSNLSVGGPGLWFDFFEQTTIDSRERTRKALDDLKMFCAEVRKYEEELIHSGYVKSITPQTAIATGTPRMTLKPGSWTGSFHVDVYVNPGRQGYVYLMMKNVDTGEYFEPEWAGSGVKEYIGWSENPETLFYYTADTRIPEEVIKDTKIVSFELWFRSSNGQPSQEWFNTAILEDDKKLIAVEHQQEPQQNF